MDRPNILWIVTTQWRAQACGYAGDPNARTPHLDALAAKSVNYPQAVAPHPMGPFARAALLTGVLSPENGVRDYFDPLPGQARTIAHDLGAQGYATAYFGKWHLWKRDPAAPLVGAAHARVVVPPAARGGFEFWEGFESGFLLNDPWLHGTGLPEPRQFPGYQSDVLADRFAAWLSQRAESRPAFAVVSMEAPHPPYFAPAAGIPIRNPGEIVLPPNVPRGGEVESIVRKDLAGYHAHIEATDRAIGRLCEIAGNWIVVFTSVHGDMHGAHGLFRKAWPHEESVRVPFLVHVPGAAPRRDEAPVSLVDLPAITRSFAGLQTAEKGLKRDHAKISMPGVMPFPRQCDRVWRGVRTPTRKLVLNADGSPWLFFDLEADPFEMNNLVARRNSTDEIAELTKLV
ncbi:MAG TPA: sulfatase-like hydrolase/transferase [Opitutaceae bacterium]|nr:sulfatase-like hydrolase/transferase [Opitutaceae bacterium]